MSFCRLLKVMLEQWWWWSMISLWLCTSKSIKVKSHTVARLSPKDFEVQLQHKHKDQRHIFFSQTSNMHILQDLKIFTQLLLRLPCRTKRYTTSCRCKQMETLLQQLAGVLAMLCTAKQNKNKKLDWIWENGWWDKTSMGCCSSVRTR